MSRENFAPAAHEVPLFRFAARLCRKKQKTLDLSLWQRLRPRLARCAAMAAAAASAAAPFYELLGVGEAATTADVRAGFKRRAVQLHPDKGGDPALFAALREAYDTLADPDRRAAYDKDVAAGAGPDGDGLGLGRAARGNAELDMLRRFREAEEYSSKDPTELQALSQAPKPVEGFEGGGIMGQLERLREQAGDQSSSTAAAAAARPPSSALARAATQRFGVAGAYDVRLPALTTEALVFASHGRADEVCRAEPEWPLGRVLRYGEVLVKMIAAPLTESELRWIETGGGGGRLPAIAGHDGVGIVVATSKCVHHYPRDPLMHRSHAPILPLLFARAVALAWLMSTLDYEIRTRGVAARTAGARGPWAPPRQQLESALGAGRRLGTRSSPCRLPHHPLSKLAHARRKPSAADAGSRARAVAEDSFTHL